MHGSRFGRAQLRALANHMHLPKMNAMQEDTSHPFFSHIKVNKILKDQLTYENTIKLLYN